MHPSWAGGRSWVVVRLKVCARTFINCCTNCSEMLAVFRAVKPFLPDLRCHHVIFWTDNTSVVSYLNNQGGLRSHPLYKLAHQILLWSQGKLLSIRTVYIPGYINQGANVLSRPREWRLYHKVVELLSEKFRRAHVDLFPSRETIHYGSPLRIRHLLCWMPCCRCISPNPWNYGLFFTLALAIFPRSLLILQGLS